MLLKQLFDQNTWTYTYLLADPSTGEAVIIDPVLEQVDRDLQLLSELGLDLLYVLDTHVHADHITGAGALRERTGAKSAVSAANQVDCADLPLRHGDVLSFGCYTLEARSTPGHTSGCLSFVLKAGGKTMAFTGDSLFIRGCGRTDFQQGDSATLYDSVHTQLFSLPDDTILFPGHDYRGHSTSTVAEEKAHNPRLKTSISKEAFIGIMDALDLAYPKRIHEALPANLACGFAEDSDPTAPLILELSPKDLEDLDTVRIVDVRSAEEFQGELSPLPKAELAPLPELKAHSKNWPKEDAILVVCRSGRRSLQACKTLHQQGFTKVANLKGGLLAWQREQETSS